MGVVVVVGQVGRDLVLRVDGLPEPGGSTGITDRRELLGGKGANQAVALAQLGVPVALIGVVGEDDVGASVLEQGRQDGIDTRWVARRGRTALLVDLVDRPGTRRLFEDVPASSLISVEDIDHAEDAVAGADVVSIQLQQPSATVLAAARCGRRHGALVVADGTPPADIRDELLASIDVLRMDATEAQLLAGKPISTVEDARALGDRLLGEGPTTVALAVPDVGDLLVWANGSELVPLSDARVTDPTGAGDAYTAGLIAALRDGAGPARAAHLASDAAASTVQRLGGRPDLEAPGRSARSARGPG